jgi:molecular chaperone DnaJ
MSGSTPDPYALLGVLPTATAPEIARAYRRLLRDHHPDTRTGGQPGPDHPLALDEVRAAYALLRDPAARAEYDRARADRDRARADRDRAPGAPPSRPRPDPRRTTHVTVVAPPVRVVAPERDVPAQPDIRVGPVLWRPAR